ncbi:MAG: hypothetical protein LBQ79_09545 [Deltaproteobacteria bacterium]|jgi:hypothetical protein|nr:hypothetical protein [Deltaproteobacteria bacterium]
MKTGYLPATALASRRGAPFTAAVGRKAGTVRSGAGKAPSAKVPDGAPLAP